MILIGVNPFIFLDSFLRREIAGRIVGPGALNIERNQKGTNKVESAPVDVFFCYNIRKLFKEL